MPEIYEERHSCEADPTLTENHVTRTGRKVEHELLLRQFLVFFIFFFGRFRRVIVIVDFFRFLFELYLVHHLDSCDFVINYKTNDEDSRKSKLHYYGQI